MPSSQLTPSGDTLDLTPNGGVMSDLRLGHFPDALDDVSDVDLIFTDPPYGIDFLPLWADLARVAERVLRPGGLLVAYSGHSYLPAVLDMLRERLSYVWMAALPMPDSSQFVWRNGLSKPPFTVLTKWKPILVFGKPGPMRSIPTDLFLGSKKTGVHHPWEQHLAPAVRIVEAFSRPGDLVLDPFLGSATFAVAANTASGGTRRFIGVEIEPETLANAQARLTALSA